MLKLRFGFEVNTERAHLGFQTGGRSAADMESSELEKRFLANPKDVVNFMAGSQSYSLSFQGKER